MATAKGPSEARRRSRRWFRCLVPPLTCLLLLVVAEGILRARPFAEAIAFDRYVEDDLLNHVLAANANHMVQHGHPQILPYRFFTNSRGLRAEGEIELPKPADLTRIVVCGDSFVEGYAHEGTLPSRLQRALEPEFARAGRRLDVINAGVGSYSPMLHYFNLRERLLALEPDLVILAIDMTDARDDAARYRPLLRRDEEGRPLGVSSRFLEVQRRILAGMSRGLPWYHPDGLLARSAGYSALARRLFHARRLEYFLEYRELIELEADELQEPPIELSYDPDHPETREWVAYSREWVARIARLLAERDVPLVLCCYPHGVQLEDPRAPACFAPWAEEARRQGVPFHDLREAVFAQPDPARLYWRDDMHLNYAGLELWADELAAFLRAEVPAVRDPVVPR